MSNLISAEKIQNNPKYHRLIKERNALAWTLSALVLIIYYGFVLMVAFAGDFLAQPISATSVIPIGVLIGIGVILASIILTAVYIRKANNTFDPLVQQIIEESK